MRRFYMIAVAGLVLALFSANAQAGTYVHYSDRGKHHHHHRHHPHHFTYKTHYPYHHPLVIYNPPVYAGNYYTSHPVYYPPVYFPPANYDNRRECREYYRTAYVEGFLRQVYTRACKLPCGRWEIVG